MSQSNVVFAAAHGIGREALFSRALELSADFARRGAELDRDGLPPIPEIVRLKNAGLLNALHAAEIGGGGLDWIDALKLVRIVARGESSLGQLLGYHYVNSQSIYWSFADQSRAKALGAETVARSLYWGAAVNPRDPGLVLTQRGNGYVLNGRKTFSTAARVSDYINANALLDGQIVNFAVPTDRPGYIANDDWDNMGQRLSDSGSVEFRDFPVYEGDFVAPPADADAPPPVLATFNTPLIQLVFVNFYLGTAEGALAAALDYVRTTTRPWITSGVARAADDPYILERVGEFTASLKASAALADLAATAVQAALSRGHDATARERGEAAAEAYAAKVHATHVSLDITSKVFEIIGARATASKYRFDRYWRNVRTHTLHDPVFYKAREVGEFVLNGTIPEVSLYS
ncbi:MULTISPECIES: acyl-CoA dehydrogenase family protein [Rhizobium]|uniref:Dibenzothiophene monooxygenase n=1 Tax=Rhizobium rhododendri TaxID=2506430 RepID=A0ABY8IQI8_9HYPH|nr:MULTISPECIES: acyl-CoA dehydrogenase family protein [Rhizobium]MBO9101442.1 acyl-CoA dehydrogenase family protein [Rhizobium sp. L58/93]MBO9134899.1 acyl-CoA dehydrogenase family protein [Rhizobium sp. B209b/85]MBO9187433.1 acyl-CoA dehydrogenase family protein [Rhizobium sp. E27B/91]MBZ5762725.1 acyl-CoA dehydrogenase [Rhizobium sp. VS19-DR96]MBZ5768706.1 acyl-CoA dehydrogenase [Rhizobium sp. VS19-DR129.2]